MMIRQTIERIKQRLSPRRQRESFHDLVAYEISTMYALKVTLHDELKSAIETPRLMPGTPYMDPAWVRDTQAALQGLAFALHEEFVKNTGDNRLRIKVMWP